MGAAAGLPSPRWPDQDQLSGNSRAIRGPDLGRTAELVQASIYSMCQEFKYFVVRDSPQSIVVSYISHPQREMLPWEAMEELGEVNKIGPLI